MVDVTRMNRLVAAFIGDLHHVPGTTIGASISIIDVITTRMRDLRDLANPLWRSGSASVIGRVIWIPVARASRVSNSINVPVRIVMDPSRLPLKIGVILEHLLWRIVVVIVIANVLGIMVKWAISEGATRTISAHLSKSFGKGASSWGHSRIDLRDHGTVDARPLEGNRTMWSAVFIVIEDRTHRSAVTHVIAALQ